MSAPFTPEQEERIRTIAIDVAIALAERIAQQHAMRIVDDLTVSEDALRARLLGSDRGRFL